MMEAVEIYKPTLFKKILNLSIYINIFISRMKHILQRIFRKNHTSDFDIKFMDIHLSKIIAKKIRAFIESNPQVIPIEFYKENGDAEKARKEWLNVLNKIAAAFENIAGTGYQDLEEEEVEEGLQLFVKYIRSLWQGDDL